MRPLRWLARNAEDIVPLALLAVAGAAIVLALLLTACEPSQPPLTPEDGAAIRALNQAWCDDPRGTLADGSCGW